MTKEAADERGTWRHHVRADVRNNQGALPSATRRIRGGRFSLWRQTVRAGTDPSETGEFGFEGRLVSDAECREPSALDRRAHQRSCGVFAKTGPVDIGDVVGI